MDILSYSKWAKRQEEAVHPCAWGGEKIVSGNEPPSAFGRQNNIRMKLILLYDVKRNFCQ